jgi:ribosomal protein L12E/L44/L45/RPP1/RPP2
MLGELIFLRAQRAQSHPAKGEKREEEEREKRREKEEEKEEKKEEKKANIIGS